jgi:Cu2+-exporting ATPase
MHDPDGTSFCCPGCREAFEVIRACGLDRYYALRDAALTPLVSAAEPGRSADPRRSFAEFDDPVFRGLHCAQRGDGLWTTDMMLEGVRCAACVWLVERLPRIVPGVAHARLDLRRSTVTLVWDDESIRLSRAAAALGRLGYTPRPARGVSARDAQRREDRRALARLAVAGACAGNVMLLALALYAGAMDAMEPVYREAFRWISMVLSLVSVAWPGRTFFAGALAALRTRTPHLDLPIAMGIAAGTAWGVVNTVRGAGEVYFDSISVLMFLLLVGRWMQRRQQRAASDAVELLFAMTPTRARIVETSADGAETVREAPIEAVVIGDTLEVLAGESVPADGVVVFGRSSLDAALLTGESRPVPVEPGDTLAAGTVNLTSPLRLRAQATGAQTRLGRLMRLVEDNAGRASRAVALADRLGGVFVIVVMVLAILTAGLWLVLDPQHPARAVEHAAALLIVTCPCALGLATPLVFTVAIGRAARRGILIKGGEAIERIARPGSLVLDKTGTLTEGRMSLVRWIASASTVDQAWLRRAVAAIEAEAAHPIAVALARGLNDRDEPLPRAAEVAQTIGGGIEGTVDGRSVIAGSAEFIASRPSVSPIDPALLAAAARSCDEGLTPVFVAADGSVHALALLGDRIRPGTHRALHALARAGWSIAVLSGDHPRVVAAVARTLGLDQRRAEGGRSPEDKLRHITDAIGPSALRPSAPASAPVVMVGDGVNDAAALAAADVGIAVHGGAEASLAAADIYLSRPGVGPLVELVHAARRTMRALRLTLGVSLVYNLAAAALCALGLISPLLAAVLMPLSSLTVVAMAARLPTFSSAPHRAGELP